VASTPHARGAQRTSAIPPLRAAAAIRTPLIEELDWLKALDRWTQ